MDFILVMCIILILTVFLVRNIEEPLRSPLIRSSAFSTHKTGIRDTNCSSDPEDAKCSDYYAEPMLSPTSVMSTGPKQANTQVLLAELKKQKALQLAYASAKGIWSMYTMRQSYISQGFSMTLATKWAKQYLPAHSQDIILRTNGEVWTVRFYRKGSGYALTGCWKRPGDIEIAEDAISEAVLVRANQSSGQRKKIGKLLVDEDGESD